MKFCPLRRSLKAQWNWGFNGEERQLKERGSKLLQTVMDELRRKVRLWVLALSLGKIRKELGVVLNFQSLSSLHGESVRK